MALKILLADDSMTAQNMGKKILTDAGYDVIAVSNGAAALKKIQSDKPDIVVLDVYMPGYNGLEVCEKIKANPETAKIPVLLTVGKMEPFRHEEANRVKADGVMIKPFEASDLTVAITNICSHKPESASISKSKNEKNEKKTDSVVSLPSVLEPKEAPVRNHDETIRLTREELKQIRENSYQDWGGSTTATPAKVEEVLLKPAESVSAPAVAFLEDTGTSAALGTSAAAALAMSPSAPATSVSDSMSYEIPMLESSAADLGLPSAASWEVGLPEFTSSVDLAPAAVETSYSHHAIDSAAEWESVPQGGATTSAIDDIPEMPPLPDDVISGSAAATESNVEAFSANVEIVADETADFGGPMPDLEYTAVQREPHAVESMPEPEPELVTNTDSRIGEFVTQFGVSPPEPVSPEGLHNYIAENNREGEHADTFSTLLQNHHIASDIPEANLPDLVAEEKERAEAAANPETSNETYAELMHSNDFDVQSLSELSESHIGLAETHNFGRENVETDHGAIQASEEGPSFGSPFNDFKPADPSRETPQTGVFQDWQADGNPSDDLNVAASSVIPDVPSYVVSSFQPSRLVERSATAVSDGTEWEVASQCEVPVVQPQTDSNLETERMTTESSSSTAISTEPLVSAAMNNLGEMASRHPGLSEDAIARAFSRVLDRFKEQLVSELAKELTKE